MRRRWRELTAVLLGLALLAGGCTEEEQAAPDAAGPGVSDEPCPDAVNEDNGCIYLGILSDLTEGPFSAFGVEIVEGQRDFWQRVNEEGGISGYDVNVDAYTRDTRFDEETHADLYLEVEPDVLALAQAMGTPGAAAILEDMDDDDMVGTPASWWSGWDFEAIDHGLMLSSGYSYCLEAQIGLDWLDGQLGDIGRVMAIGYPGGYGDDGAAGVQAWAEATGTNYTGFVQTEPNAVVGDQDAVVQAVLDAAPDAVQLSVGPAETGEIVAKAAARGFEGMFLGSAPTWDPQLVSNPEVAQVIQALYRHVGPSEGFQGESAAHEAMREARGEQYPANDGYTFGWVSSYPLRALLEAAVEDEQVTRGALRDAIDGLVVDYEGALPQRTFGGAPGEDVPRVATISVPDPQAPLGLSTLDADVSGPTADAFEYEEPCSKP